MRFMENKRIGVRLRGRALLVDAVAIVLLWFGSSLLTQELSMRNAGGTLQSGKRYVGLWFLLIVTPPLIALAYAACDVFFAATPGKWMLKLRIADATGRRATRGQLVGRFTVKFAWLIALAGWLAYFAVHVALTNGRGLGAVLRANVFVLPFVGLLALAAGVGGLWTFKPPRQALHDRIARTAVFRREDVTASSFEPILAAPVQSAGPMKKGGIKGVS